MARRAGAELVEGLTAAEGGAAMDGGSADRKLLKLAGHEVGMGDGDAEGEGARLGVGAPLAMGVPGAGEGGELFEKLLGVEVAVAPGEFAVVDVFVIDAVVGERHEELRVDAGDEVSQRRGCRRRGRGYRFGRCGRGWR
jgi:hypothetical protein